VSKRDDPTASPASQTVNWKPATGKSTSNLGIPRGAGLKEIAERANVTKMTVSRALRTPTKVAPATLRRIETAIAELDFVPNYIAGSLSTRNSRIVPVIVPTMASSIFSDFIEEVTLKLEAAGFTPVFGSSNFDINYEERLFRRYIGWQPSALVIVGEARSPGILEMSRRSQFPVIRTWCLPDNNLGPVVGFSNFQALYRIVRSLQEWGHKNIGFGYIDTLGNDRSLQRRRGWERAVREGGSEPLDSQAQGGLLSLDEGARILRGILERHPETDAIAFGSDVLAVGAILECRRLGVQVPAQLAITGCGDMGLSSIVTPSLTTMRVPGREIGSVCAEMAAQLIEGTYGGPTVVELETSLVRRESA
jgi:LacI family gluconate utilization system Gnt-I transcriptional repressor